MTTIGVYDSGIGGLTTLIQLIKNFPNLDYYYLADNKNMPFGNKSNDDISAIVTRGITKLKAHSDIQVLACNTASTILNAADIYRLQPPLYIKGKSLLLATSATINTLKQSGLLNECNYLLADTAELAELVETYVAIGTRKNCLNMRETLPYLAAKLFKFKGVENVILGCSHYLYLKTEIKTILGSVNFFDGNATLINSLKAELSSTDSVKSNTGIKVHFDFTADDESAKYDKILSLLLKETQ